MAEFVWDTDKREVATWIAIGDMTMDEISEKKDIGLSTLFLWKRQQEFKNEVARLKTEIREEVLYNEIADVVHRVKRLNKRWKQIEQLTNARAIQHAHVPGGDTGLLVKDIKSVGSGPSAEIVDVYSFDAALLKEEREIAKQAAQETGQWMEKHELNFAKLTDAELIARAKELFGGDPEKGSSETEG